VAQWLQQQGIDVASVWSDPAKRNPLVERYIQEMQNNNPQGGSPVAPQGGDIYGDPREDPAWYDFEKWVYRSVQRQFGTDAARAKTYLDDLFGPNPQGNLMQWYQSWKENPNYDPPIDIRDPGNPKGPGDPQPGDTDTAREEAEKNKRRQGFVPSKTPADKGVGGGTSQGDDWRAGIQAQIDEYRRRLADPSQFESNPGQAYEFMGRINQLQGLLDQGATSSYDTPTQFGTGYTPTQFGAGTGTQSSVDPNRDAMMQVLKLKIQTNSGTPEEIESYKARLATLEQQGQSGLSSTPTDFTIPKDLKGFQYEDPTKYYAPEATNAYFDTARGNLSGQAGTASSQAANRGAAMAASRGLVNPSGFTSAVASQAYAPFATQMGNLEVDRAKTLADNQQKLFSALLQSQQLTQGDKQQQINNFLNQQGATESTRQFGIGQDFQNQQASEASRQFAANQQGQAQSAAEQARQFQLNAAFQNQQNLFNQGQQYTGMGQLYSNNKPNEFWNALGGLFGAAKSGASLLFPGTYGGK